VIANASITITMPRTVEIAAAEPTSESWKARR
jgi:hypothetical protein